MIHIMRSTSRSITIAVFGLLIALAGVTGMQTAYAEDSNGNTKAESVETENSADHSVPMRDRINETNRQSMKEEAAKQGRQAEKRTENKHPNTGSEKLSATKLQVCNDRKANIESRIERIVERTGQQLILFDTISGRAQEFYISKGNTLENYDTLVADVNSKHAFAKIAVDALSTQKNAFDCEAINPKSTITDFKATLEHTIDALKAYRTSVKELIVAIKSVQRVSNTPTEDIE